MLTGEHQETATEVIILKGCLQKKIKMRNYNKEFQHVAKWFPPLTSIQVSPSFL